MRRLGMALLVALATWLLMGQGPGGAQTSPTTSSTVRVTTSSSSVTTSSTTSTTRPATAPTTTRAPLVNTGSETGPTSATGIALVLLGAVLVRAAHQRRINGPYRIRYR